MAARNRKKKQGCDEAEFLGCKKEDPWALVRKLEAQIAQLKFFHEKTKTDYQYEIKTLQAKVKNLERQRKVFLGKLEQNPIEEQNKLEKELNDTSRLLREATQKLVTSQQQVDKLLRSNRGIKKSKEKMEEEFLDLVESKNALIHKLEAQIRDLRISRRVEDIQAHKNTAPHSEEPNYQMEMWDHSDDESAQAGDEDQNNDDQDDMARIEDLTSRDDLRAPNKNIPKESNDYWQPTDTMEMWDQSDDENAQVEEEKGRKEHQYNMNASKTLEEKNKVDCKVSFFPSMYDNNGNEGNRERSLHQRGFQNQPKNFEANCKANSNEQLSPVKQTINESSVMKDETQNQTGYNVIVNEVTTQKHKGEETKQALQSKKLKCWTKAKMDYIARYGCYRNTVNTGSASDCMTKVREFYTKITPRTKADATGGITGVNVPPPPPGFNAFDTKLALQAGFNFLEL